MTDPEAQRALVPTIEPINLFDFELLAEQAMAHNEFDYVAGGATDELTLRRTRSAYEHLALRPRVLAGNAAADLSTTVLGQRIEVPFMLSPSGGHKRAHPDAELATARAAAHMGTVMGLTANSSVPIEDVAAETGGPKWFQTYFYRDRELTLDMVKRAEQAGFSAIILTLDAHWPSKRERNIRNKYQRRARVNYTPERETQADANAKSMFDSGQSSRGLNDPAASWADIEWLKTATDLPLVAKGIMTGEDASLCAEYEVAGLIVSNHGARNLDTTLSTIEVLPEVAAAAGERVEVYLDGGIRRGTDVVKAIALGAKGVFFGRPIFWGLSYGGSDGLIKLMEVLRDEVESTMMLTGRGSIESIDASLVTPMPALG